MRTYQNRIVFLLFVFATTLTGIAAQNTAATDHIRPKVDEYMNARLAVKNLDLWYNLELPFDMVEYN